MKNKNVRSQLPLRDVLSCLLEICASNIPGQLASDIHCELRQAVELISKADLLLT